jgi:spore germination protein KC
MERGSKAVKSWLKNKKIIIVILAFSLQLFFNGCVYRIDIQKLSIVVGMGVDISEEGRYIVSFQMLEAGSSGKEGTGINGGKNGEVGVLYLEGNGETIYDATQNASDKISKKLHYGQLKVFIIGEKAAEKGIAGIVDFLGRFNEIRTNLPIFATKGEASPLLREPTGESSVPANAIEDMMLKQIQVGSHPVIYLAQLIDTMGAEDRYTILSVLAQYKKNEPSEVSGFRMDGIAVFEEDKLSSYLGNRETKGYQYINGKIDKGSSVVKTNDGTKVSLEIVKTSSKVETEVINGRVSVAININQDCSIIEMPGKINAERNPEILDEIGELQAKSIEALVESTLSVIQKDIGKDIVDIGGQVYRQHPKEWKTIKKEWKSIFPNLKIEVNANVRVKGTGLLAKPVF